MIYVPRVGIDNGIVVHGVELVDKNPLGLTDRIENRSEDLRNASQGVVGLYLVLEIVLRMFVIEFDFAFEQAAAALCGEAHGGSYLPLPCVLLEGIEGLGEEIIV